jgi:putative ABC transport system permease protein
MRMSLERLIRDFQYAMRGVRKKPGFAIAVVSTLALGIGANAAMFGIVDRLLFRPPAYMTDPETAHIVYTYSTFRGEERPRGVGQYVRYTDLAKWTTSFSNAAGYTTRQLAVGVGENAREMQIGVVSAAFFKFFDAPPVLGRYFTEDEDRTPAGTAVVVLGRTMWETQYGGAQDVLGKMIQIGPTTYTIIGVAPKGFVGLWADRPPAAFIPITSYAAGQRGIGGPTRQWWETYSWGWMGMLVRRKASVSLQTANADLTQAYLKSWEAQLVEQPTVTPASLARPHAIAGPILSQRGPTASATSRVATWVGGMSIIVVLIACANVANLLLARALRRRREIALRLALGVSRKRLVSQLLTESLLLGLLGGALGILVAHWGGAALRGGLLERSEAAAGFRDPRTVLFALVAAIIVGVLTGLAPVLQAQRADLTGDLKAGTREGTYRRSRTRVALLVLQGALSVILLVGAGLFVRSLSNVNGVRLGYDVEPLLIVDLNMRGMPSDTVQEWALRERLLRAAKTIPGVVNASLQRAVPFWSTSSTSLFVDGIDTVARLGQFNYNPVSPEHFATLGTRILRGRGITEQDQATTPLAMVVSEAMGKVLWPGKDPIGQCIKVRADTMPCTYVVGIAENIRAQGLSADSGYYYYIPAAQWRSATGGGLFVRASGHGANMREAVRKRLQQEMPGASYVVVTPFSEIIGPLSRSWKLGATMFVAFGILALVLAAIGLYSVIAYNVAQRTHELGVRRALGAQASHVMRLVVGDGLRVAGVGVAIGVIVAIWAGKWVKPLLFNVSPRDPVVFVFVATTLILVALAASWIPALRASRVDANVALRTD